MGFFARMFTPSKSDNQSGEQFNQAYNAAQQAQAPLPAAPKPEDAAGVAAAEVERKRRMRMLAGGETVLAGNAKPTLGSSGGSSPKSLLGS